MRLSTYCRVMVVATFLLIVAGGLVTSTGSGLAVPDWPLSYGMLFPPMVGGILYEHGHRMVAGTVAILTIVLGIWLRRAEPRRWVRRLGLLAIVAVALQATLGGLTVLFLLPLPISVAHACLGQTFFCLVVAIAVATSRGWRETPTTHETRATAAPSADFDPLFRLAIATTGAIYIQLILGALVRHTKSALAIPDFPLALGRVVPPLGDPHVAVHFAHRVGAALVVALVAATAARVFRGHDGDDRLTGAATLLCLLAVLQSFLGAATIWSKVAVPVATAHVACGALVLAAALSLAMKAGAARRAAHAPATRGAPAAAGESAAERRTRPAARQQEIPA